MPIEDGVNGAAGRDFYFRGQSSKEPFPDLAGAPVRFLAPGGYDGGFDLLGQPVGVAMGAPGAIRQTLQSAFLIAFEDLVAGLPGDLKLAAQSGHALAVFEPNHESYALVHNRTFLPWHSTRPPFQGKKCNPCLRYVLLPMSQAAHSWIPATRPLRRQAPLVRIRARPAFQSRRGPMYSELEQSRCGISLPSPPMRRHVPAKPFGEGANGDPA